MIKKMLILCLIFSYSFVYAQGADTEETEESSEVEEEVAPDQTMNKFKDIVVTSSYGAFVGSVTGLALLAFVSKPQSKLKYIAVGASLGLYAGTLLGVYLTFGVSLPPPIDTDLEDYDLDEEDYGYLKIDDYNDLAMYNNEVKIQVPVLVYNF